MMGQLVTTLKNKPMSAGYHSVDFNGFGLSSGVYLYRLQFDDRQKVGQMMLIK
jgi:hypothetical protein